jgi:hypothetical protein
MMSVAAEDEEDRRAILDKLAHSRGEISQILDPPPQGEQGNGEAARSSQGEFPRSRTMRALLSSRGIGAVGALSAGLLIARPALALRLLRMVPVSMLSKMLLAKGLTLLRGRSDH